MHGCGCPVSHSFIPCEAMRLFGKLGLLSYGVSFLGTHNLMTSEERHEVRYQRRKARREEKRLAKNDALDYAKVFTYKNLYKAYKKCRRGVAWKASTQKYIVQAPLEVYQVHERLKKGTFKTDGFYEFDLYERGKKRHIRSVTMRERVVQRCLCDNSLVPMVGRTFIYDNGASLERKGYHFAMNRLIRHLQWHYRKFRSDGYILLFDFRHFFDNVSHEIVRNVLSRLYNDQRLYDLIMHFVDAFGEKGMGLGSQISQTLALLTADRLDHVIKEEMRIRCYARYMDDGYLIHHDKDYLKKCLERIHEICMEYGIELNEKKTQIVKLSHGFNWLKARIYLTESGRIVKKIYKRSITKMRQKLKDFKRLVENEKMTIEDVRTSVQCWMAYALHSDACGTIKSMISLVFQLFGKEKGFWILKTGKIKKNSIYRKRKYIARTVRSEYHRLAA